MAVIAPQKITKLPVAYHPIRTDFSGYTQLVDFYHTAKQYSNQTIELIFTEVPWFAANMASLFSAILCKLYWENNLLFTTDYGVIKEKYDVLFRNGFLKLEGYENDHQRQSTLPYAQFGKDDKDQFIKYITCDLLNHRGMPPLNENKREQIKDDLIEIMSNINYHSNTSYPFFICGQYYPADKNLVISIVDLGDGFLPKIKHFTNGEVNSSKSAILWAVQGNTTKPLEEKVPGGLGIRNIHKYCLENGGEFHIVTGDAYWSSAFKGTFFEGGRTIACPFTGSMINLFFKH